MYRLLPGLLGGLALATAVCAGDVRADEGECPRLSDVVAGLGQVLSTEQATESASEIVIRDQGASWSIEVRGQTATYSDPARQCAERARVATVFAALALEPMNADASPAAAVEAEHPTSLLSVEAGPQVTLAALAQGRNTPVGWGGQARLSRLGGRLGVSLGIEAATFSKLDLGWYGASIFRAACDLSGRIQWASRSFALAGELGPTLALLRVRGTGLGKTSGVNRIDVGARVGIMARLRTRLAPFLALQVEIGVRRFDLTVDPSGPIGTMPRLWLGLVGGGVLDL